MAMRMAMTNMSMVLRLFEWPFYSFESSLLLSANDPLWPHRMRHQTLCSHNKYQNHLNSDVLVFNPFKLTAHPREVKCGGNQRVYHVEQKQLLVISMHLLAEPIFALKSHLLDELIILNSKGFVLSRFTHCLI